MNFFGIFKKNNKKRRTQPTIRYKKAGMSLEIISKEDITKEEVKSIADIIISNMQLPNHSHMDIGNKIAKEICYRLDHKYAVKVYQIKKLWTIKLMKGKMEKES